VTADDAVLAALADALVPSDGDMPCASRAGVPGDGVEIVLRVRPELAQPLDVLLVAARGIDPAEHLRHLRDADPDAFSVLTLVVVGGYLQDAGVQRALGYAGRVPAPLDEPDATDAFETELLAPVRARGARYRLTPQ
jgi:hypothetical protein